MSRNVPFSHAVPFQIWLHIISLLVFPIILNTFLIFSSLNLKHYLVEMIWFVYIFPPIIFACYCGLRGAILSSVALQVIHSLYEILAHTEKGLLIDEVCFIVTQFLLSVVASYVVSTSTKKLKQKQTKLELAYKDIENLAYYDPLTSLPNRRLFLQQLDMEIMKHKQNETVFALLFIDLDGFKAINDTFGHEAGDVLLQEVSRRFTTCIRREDCLARFAGDEFTVLLVNITQNDAFEVAERLLTILQPSFMIQNQAVSITASVGMAFYPSSGETAEALMKYTDEAMYTVKKQGKNNYHLYTRNA